MRVFRPVAEADCRILIGSVLPHLQAGFGGGYKLIFPGTSHRSTLGALHRQGLGGDAGRLLGGDARENPMRRAIRSAAGLLGPCVSISHLMGGPGQVLRVAAGHPDPVQDRLALEARRRFRAPEGPAADLIVAGNHPWPGDPMQSFKVLLQHRAATRPGGRPGRLLLDRARPDRPLVPDAPDAGDRGDRAPWGVGAPPGPGGGRPRPVGPREPERVHGPLGLRAGGRPDGPGLRPPLHDRLGPRLGPIRLYADQGRLWRDAAEPWPATRPRVRVFPQGGLTYVPERQAIPPDPGAV